MTSFRILGAVATMLLTAMSAGAAATLTPIITNPKGQEINYNKEAAGTFKFYNSLSMYKDEFPATVIYGEGGKVYFKNIVSVFPDEYYVEGTIKGNTITVPMNQTIEYIEEEGYGINLGVLKTVPRMENGQEVIDFEYAEEIKSVSLTVAADGSMDLVLPGKPFDGENPTEYVMGFYYTDDYSFTGYSDFSQKYTKLDLQLIKIPDGAEIQDFAYVDTYNYASIVEVAFVGDDLYIRGLSSMLPEATLKAKISGNKAIIAQDEYLGIYFDQYYIFTKVLYANPDYDENDPDGIPFIFAPSDVGFELTIDPDRRRIYADKEGVYLSFHCDGDDFLNSLGFYDVFTLKYQETLAGTPSNPVALEYTTEWEPYQGYNDFFFTLSNFSTDGNVLDVDVLYYKVFVDGTPVVFKERKQENTLGEYVTVYPNVPIAVELLPYEFNNNEDIFKFGENAFGIGIYSKDVKTVGVQSVYHYNDEFTYSDIVTLDVETGEISVSAVEEVYSDEVTASEYYTLDGRKVVNPDHGIYIRVDTLSDGHKKSEKIVM